MLIAVMRLGNTEWVNGTEGRITPHIDNNEKKTKIGNAVWCGNNLIPHNTRALFSVETATVAFNKAKKSNLLQHLNQSNLIIWYFPASLHWITTSTAFISTTKTGLEIILKCQNPDFPVKNICLNVLHAVPTTKAHGLTVSFQFRKLVSEVQIMKSGPLRSVRSSNQYFVSGTTLSWDSCDFWHGTSHVLLPVFTQTCAMIDLTYTRHVYLLNLSLKKTHYFLILSQSCSCRKNLTQPTIDQNTFISVASAFVFSRSGLDPFSCRNMVEAGALSGCWDWEITCWYHAAALSARRRQT